MAREIPEVVRAVAGLAATVLDEARKLPETLPGLPVRLIGQALQKSLQLQQQYSGLVARGDEVFTGLRGDAEPGMATFDDDLPASTGTPAPRSSAFDRAADPDPVAEELADELADDLAVADLPLADTDDLSAEAAAVLTIDPQDGSELTPAEVAGLPADQPADELTAVVDDLAAEVADEVAAEVPDAVPDEVLEDLTADAVASVAEEEAAVEEAVADELIADAVVGGAPPQDDALPTDDVVPADDALRVEEVPQIPAAADLTPDTAPAAPAPGATADEELSAVEAVEAAADELVDLGGPEAAESVTPGSDVTDSAATDPLAAPGTDSDNDPDAVPVDALADATEELVDLGGPEAAESVTPGSDVTDSAASDPLIAPDADDTAAETPAPTSPVEGYDSYSIPALRGHLRAYPVETVADLLDYERATRARPPYVTLLQNRLEKLSADRG